MLIFWGLSSGMSGLNYLGEYAAGRGRMKKGYLGAADAGAWALVDQPDPGCAQRLKSLLDRGDAVGDVVKARPAAGEELAHGGVRIEGLQELDMPVAYLEQGGIDPLCRDGLAVDQGHAERVAIQRERGVDGLDGHADVVDRGQHSAP